MTEKNPKTKTIEVSTETYARIHNVKVNLAKIIRKPASFDTAFKLYFAIHPLDVILDDLLLEEQQQ